MMTEIKMVEVTEQIRKVTVRQNCDELKMMSVRDVDGRLLINFECHAQDHEYTILLEGDEARDFIQKCAAFFYEEEYALEVKEKAS